ncbi:UNVERIFIED_CONTAM: hypothetical protein Sangu_0708500 [Sesamum angustifolium]|uniref:F-box associated beta-propeller type 1 domain-containing protein n=1 Tax=Sesamum angustifolium TaxID=2727405 RepID=A0AAW2PSR0_9LAMI
MHMRSIIDTARRFRPFRQHVHTEICKRLRYLQRACCFSRRGNFVWCNPTLREFKVLPLSNPITVLEGYKITIFLERGYGFDADTNSYKFVSVVLVKEQVSHLDLDTSYEEDNYITTNVYDSSIDSWRTIDTKLSDLDHKPEFNLLFNGAQHWKVTTHDRCEQNSNHDDVGHKILCFDMSSEVFKIDFVSPDILS